LLTIDKEVFAHICPAIFDEELQEKVEFIRSVILVYDF